MTLPPVVETGMTIRRPIAEVYRAFVDPAVTTRFWFTRASGPLEPGVTVQWDWEMYGVGADVAVKALEPPRRILIEWDGPDAPTQVEWRLEERGAATTHVTIVNRGFHGDDDARLAAALDAMSGFSLVLAGAKAWLEHGLVLNLVADKFPDAWTRGWPSSEEDRT